MKTPDLKTANRVIPTIYAYTTPEIARHNGWTKIGYTEQLTEKRIQQQAHTIDVQYNLEWKGNAIFDDGSGECFTDKQFHAYLRKQGVSQEEGKNNEWFKITGEESHNKFYKFREDHGILLALNTVVPYILRDEQAAAVKQAKEYKDTHDKAEFLWNAKPRFGKTLAVYDLCKQIDAKSVLIVTNRPAIANSWYSDYVHFLGAESGYKFVSDNPSLKGKPYVLSRSEYIDSIDENTKLIEFVSLQDLKGSIYFGGKFDKLKYLTEQQFSALIIDEAHEGIDTYKTDVAFDKIKRDFTLHLSGTPFKALANDKFPDSAIFNWTYADEQGKKQDWKDEDGENPYGTLPKLNLYTYQMSEIIKEELEQGIEINGETEEYAFDLNEFFETNGNGTFLHNDAVDRFLHALTTQEKFPFSTDALRNELKHTFWMLNRVDSAKALAKKLNNHPVFKEYKVILAAGDGKLDEFDETKKSFDAVVDAIKKYDKTITLSVGQLTTGVTIPEWSAVLMLSNMKSPSLYMQAAFRAQNPCLYNINGEFLRKENAYVFDFDPARTLTIFEEFANDLSPDTASGKGDTDTRKQHVRELLNFFPVIGEDEDGEMIQLDAEKVLSIPRKIRSKEVVRRGFMSNYLFQNISNIFGAPKEVTDILKKFAPVEAPKNKLPENLTTSVTVDENGEPILDEDYVIGKSKELFGEKIYEKIEDDIADAVEKVQNEPTENLQNKFKDLFMDHAVGGIVDIVANEYKDEIKPSDKKQIERTLERQVDRTINTIVGSYEIKANLIEKQRQDALNTRLLLNKTEEEINKEFAEKKKAELDALTQEIQNKVSDFTKEASIEAVKTVEKNIEERKKDTVEDRVRDHLRGFTRTIPSFIMAYGSEDEEGNPNVTLATFDSRVPDKVFIEVTSITLDEFRFLRDGGEYIDEETGETKRFKGNLFDAVVFDDSVKEFLRLKKKLANYFDEHAIEDIFDYIPPQQTNQIFTPKRTVKQMVDLLEKENPGCFDMPDKTFIDLYMKSGLYITEIVKRLYQSPKMKELFPDDKERLRHIFAKQVYGLAPTEIIYDIAKSYILGFSEDIPIEKHNLRLGDAEPHAKDGTLEEWLDEIFREEK